MQRLDSEIVEGLAERPLATHYNPARDIIPEFVDRVAAWIATSGEVFVVVRWVGGFRDFALCRSRSDFEKIAELVGDGTELVVFRDPQVSIRGGVDEGMIARAVETIPDRADYLVITLATRPDSPLSDRVATGDSHADLKETLRDRDWWGVEVAIGAPDWCIPDNEAVISRAKGGVEGPR